TRGGTVLAQPYHVELSADERDLLSGGAAARVIVRADGERWLASAAPVGTLGWMVVVAQRAEMALRPAAVVRQYTLFWVAVSLGAGMAHELNNPITAITGIAALLRKELEGTPHEEQLRTLQEQARRISSIVGNLRTFADQERTQPGRRFPLHSSVLAALDLYERQMREKGIELATEIKSCDAQGDPAQMQEAIAHIVQNAISAMPEGGRLKVTLSDVNGDALKLSVTDTGRGIPKAMRDRIFDPFFTTKEGPGGVGLGLSISHSIVEAHHGKLLVDSAEGQGA